MEALDLSPQNSVHIYILQCTYLHIYSFEGFVGLVKPNRMKNAVTSLSSAPDHPDLPKYSELGATGTIWIL